MVNWFAVTVGIVLLILLFSGNALLALLAIGLALTYIAYNIYLKLVEEEVKDYYKEAMLQLRSDLRDNRLQNPGYLIQMGTQGIEIDNLKRGRVVGAIEGSYLLREYGDRAYTEAIKKAGKAITKDTVGKEFYVVLYENARKAGLFSFITGIPTEVLIVPKDIAEINLGNVIVNCSSFVTVLGLKVPNNYVDKNAAIEMLRDLFMEQVVKTQMEQFGFIVDKRADMNVAFSQLKKTSEVDLPKPDVDKK